MALCSRQSASLRRRLPEVADSDASPEFGRGRNRGLMNCCLEFTPNPGLNITPEERDSAKNETPPGIRREGHGLVSVLPCRLLCCAFVPDEPVQSNPLFTEWS